jgi:hypothetical protein
MSPLLFKPNLDEVINRHRLLWSRKLTHGVLAILDIKDAPSDPINLSSELQGTEMDPLSQSYDIKKMFRAWEICFEIRKNLLDDSLPVARMGIGGYELGGMLGGELIFPEKGPPWLASPILKDWEMIDSISLKESNYWYKLRMEMCKFFNLHAQGKFVCCEGDNITSGNLLELLRGANAYTDIIDNPEKCIEAITKGLYWVKDLIIMQRELLKDVRYYKDGSFHNFYIWLPENVVWLSMDFYCQCKPGTYQKIGMKQDQTLIGELGDSWCWVHTHSNGLHIIADILKLNNLKGLQISEDPPPSPRPFERIFEIRSITKDLPLYISCNYEEFSKSLYNKELPGGIIYQVFDVPSISEGNKLMEKIKSYSSNL